MSYLSPPLVVEYAYDSKFYLRFNFYNMYTNAHIIHPTDFQKGIVSYPDRYSYRAQESRRNSYLLRLYWHFRQYFDDGKTVFFDTLTYDDEHLPHVQDVADFPDNFSCFRPSDVKHFLDRLHSRFAYYNLGTFTHFICSEYGHDDLYVDSRGRCRKGTKRPHYHILLFLDGSVDGFVDPMQLASMVHDCWQQGLTDNFGRYEGDRTKNYVLHNTFTKDTVSKDRMLALCHYLSKYVLKDAKYSKKVDDTIRKYVYRKYVHSSDCGEASISHGLTDVCQCKAFTHDCDFLRRQIAEFICISNGFGTYALHPDNLDMKLIYERSQMSMPDKDKIVRYIRIPEYYLRKLFYVCKRGHWLLNDEGKKYYKNHLRNLSHNYSRFLQNVFVNLSEVDRFNVYRMLDGRSFDDVADYVVYYQGRICNPKYLDGMPDKDNIVQRLILIDDDIDEFFYILNDPIPKIVYYRSVEPRTYWHVDDVGHFSYVSPTDVLKRHISVENWKDYIIDSSWFPEHYDFDEILAIIMDYVGHVQVMNQQTYDEKSSLNANLRHLGFKTSTK